MRIEGIIWLRDVVDKLASKHDVETYEVEHVLDGKPKIRFVEKEEREGEDVFLALGQTDSKILSRLVHLQTDQRGIDYECQRYGVKRAEAIWQKVNPDLCPSSLLLTSW